MSPVYSSIARGESENMKYDALLMMRAPYNATVSFDRFHGTILLSSVFHLCFSFYWVYKGYILYTTLFGIKNAYVLPLIQIL